MNARACCLRMRKTLKNLDLESLQLACLIQILVGARISAIDSDLTPEELEKGIKLMVALKAELDAGLAEST